MDIPSQLPTGYFTVTRGTSEIQTLMAISQTHEYNTGRLMYLGENPVARIKLGNHYLINIFQLPNSQFVEGVLRQLVSIDCYKVGRIFIPKKSENIDTGKVIFNFRNELIGKYEKLINF